MISSNKKITSCKQAEIYQKKYFPVFDVKEYSDEAFSGDCIMEWNKDIFKNYDINNFFSENLCYQEKLPTVYNSPKVSIDCSDEKTVDEFKKSPIFSSYQKVEDEYNCYFYFWRQKKQEIYKKPELKRCESGQNPGKNYENCCPASDYDLLILKKKLEEKNGIFEKKEIKTETKQVIVPVHRPLTVEEMGLLEATIYGSFVIVKSLLK